MLLPLVPKTQNLEPAKVKLYYSEACTTFEYIQAQAAKVDQPNVRDELIVLAEYYHTHKLLSQTVRHEQHKKGSQMLYTIPISIVRLLHRRWQQEPISDALQQVLNAFDYLLVQRGMKPEVGQLQIIG